MTREGEALIEAVHVCFRERGFTLAVAESCTGGLVCDYLTDLSGASDLFVAGAIVYAARAKKALAGVSAAVIEQHGVVSRETAIAMAEGIRTIVETDWAVSTTGNLGPDTLEEKDAGLVYIAVSCRTGTVARELRLHGDRRQNKEEAAIAALRLLLESTDCTLPPEDRMTP